MSRAAAMRTRRRGSALVIVLLALALLFSLGVPYLMVTRMREESAAEAYGRAQARIAVSSAAATFAAHQEGSHPAADPTPLHDAPSEWDGTTFAVLPQSLGGGWEESTESWGAEIASAQARVSLGSAPPLLLQNLVHPSYLTQDVSFREDEIPVTSTDGFPDQGLAVIGGTWIEYAGKRGNAFLGVVPAALPPDDLDETRFREGRLVLDPRIWLMTLARLRSGQHRAPEFPGDVLDLGIDAAAGSLLEEAERRRLHDLTALRSGGHGSADWMPGTWMIQPINPEEPDQIAVGDADFANAGSVIRIEAEDRPAIDTVVLAAGGGRLLVAGPLPLDLPVLWTRVSALRREPVDVNACAPEILEALALGVAFAGGIPVVSDLAASGRPGREWVNPAEARAFAARLISSRPLRGPDDLWARVLAPLAVEGRLSDLDAWALWMNSVDPTHGALRQSTTSFSYRSGDRYLARVQTAVRSRLGRSLARRAESLEIEAAPDGPLTALVVDQLFLDDATRWGRGLHRVTALPNALGRMRAGFHTAMTTPSLRMGVLSQVGRVLPEEDPAEFALMPESVSEPDAWGPNTQGRVEHFDFEPTPFGRQIARRGPLAESLAQWNVPLTNGFSLVEPLAVEAWFEAENGIRDAVLFDLAGAELRRNRFAAFFEGGELLLRAWDAAGEDPYDLDGQEQAWTVRLDPAEFPLADRPFHLSALLRGVGPGGVQFAVDGVPRGREDGRTWLTSPAQSYAPGDVGGTLQVESTEGFPSRGALRVGGEVIEYSSKTQTAFVLDRLSGGAAGAYLGGRAVREQSDPRALALPTAHPEGSGVELYGYSAVIDRDLAPGGGSLSGSVGPWSLAHAPVGIEDLNLVLLGGFPLYLGKGITSDWIGELELGPLIAGDELYAEAFQSDGGYLVMWQTYNWFVNGAEALMEDGSRLGGLEVMHYDQRDGTKLRITERNVLTPRYAQTRDNDVYFADGNSFIMEWNEALATAEGPIFENPRHRVHVMPISIKGNGVSDLAYVPGVEEFSAFVQISTAGDSSLTEWVRYDSILNNCFLRDDWDAISFAIRNYYSDDPEEFETGPGGGGGGGGGPGGGSGGGSGGGGPGSGGTGTIPRSGARAELPTLGDPAFFAPPPLAASNAPAASAVAVPTAAAPPAPQEPVNDYEFRPTIGEPVADRDDVLTQILEDFDFRGTMGTFDHAQEPGALLIPVFTTLRQDDAASGYVGRLDRVAVMQPQSGDAAPDWFTVEWAQAPPDRVRVRQNVTYAAFDAHPGIPYLGSNFEALDAQDQNDDLRNYARLIKFPSRERPINLESLTWGADVTGSAAFDGVVDEATVHTAGGFGSPSSPLGRACLVLEEELSEGEESSLVVSPWMVLVDGYPTYAPVQGAYLQQLATNGLLEIDGERIAFVDLDTGSGRISIAPNGRGLHGTERRAHAENASAHLADGRYATTLLSDLGVGDAVIQVADGNALARGGLILIGEELLHAPLRPAGGGAVAMPRHRPEPDSLSAEPGDGAMRGRFGTLPQPHQAGELVYSFPTRWMDGWEARCDDPALTWLELGFEAPDASWRGIAWETETPDGTQRVRALARSGTARWDDDPERTPGLVLIEKGTRNDGGFVPLNLRDDRLELRFFFDWESGAFDPVSFQASGWTQAPRVRRIVLDYLAQTRIGRAVEVIE